jgi:GLPGLI family protein
MKPFLVKDSTSIFEWTIKDEFKTILGYKCQKASVNYRGRNYTAYFTLDLPFNTGPWKFDGLPGTILEVTEENNVLNLMANKVELLNKNIVIEKPYLNKTPITWDEYLTEYRKKNKELMSYSDENGVTMSLPKRKIEVLIED